jgi:hypothetical protein
MQRLFLLSSCMQHLSTVPQVFNRNHEGRFYQIYQPNKWKAKKKAAADQAAGSV